MSAELLTHEVSERRTGAGALGLTLGAFAFLGLAVSGSLGSALDEMTKSFPKALTAFLGADVPGGYVVGEIFTLIAPIALVAYGILAGASAGAGEEASGTMSILSAQPVTRSRILVAKAGGLALSLVAVAALFWAGMALSSAVFDSTITAGALAAGTVHLLFLGLAFAAVALAVAAATGSPEVASGAAGGFAVAAYLANAMLPLAGLGGWAELSPWYYALGSDPLRHGVDVAHLAVLSAIVVIALVVAFSTFRRRDLKG